MLKKQFITSLHQPPVLIKKSASITSTCCWPNSLPNVQLNIISTFDKSGILLWSSKAFLSILILLTGYPFSFPGFQAIYKNHRLQKNFTTPVMLE